MFFRKKEVFPESPVKVDNALPTMALSSHDDKAKPSKELMNISLDAIAEARKIDLSSVCKRMKAPPFYPNIWPGEHYKLLAGFVKVCKPKCVVEIGTYQGLSLLSLKEHLPQGSKILSFDVVPWQNIEGTILKEEDFEVNRSYQIVADLSIPSVFEAHKRMLSEAEVIFIDVTHDGILEEKLYTLLKTVIFKKEPLIIFDDIRFFSMLKFWRNIADPKIDLTSFGHWSGTGVTLWQ